MSNTSFNRYIRDARFGEYFISELGWNNPHAPAILPPVVVDDVEYRPQVVAERSSFRILVCEVDAAPANSACRRIDIKVRNFANDYILIFVSRSGFHHRWLVPVRKVDKRDIVTIDYTNIGQAEFLSQKIDRLAFGFDEVSTIVDVRARIQDCFAVNSEKLTKDFYAGFKKEHGAFVTFISGIEGTETMHRDREWYASVMLNRLMFCYFIQKKGFLDGDTGYLKNKLEWIQEERGKGHFFRTFYLDFLKNLFHDGLNAPRHDAEFEKIYGRIPYLNGGMFDEHQIERDYADIDIADEAFERLFRFFDKWEWHLDTRISASGKDINPDVLGYIFEQYINDRAAMGAYYTKEDITEYIGRNCILPYLFDKVRTSTVDSAKEFTADGYVWRTLTASGDRYIFDAVKKGHDKFCEIPADIAKGIITDNMRKEYSETPVGELREDHIPLAELRKEWNTRTPEKWGLPNEIWRETIDRLQRCDDILSKIKRGEITSINDFITYNLDIRTFAYDLIANGDSRFVGWFYHALQEVTILDPTCGSGAFLFAAMNILEPLYEICIDRMQEFNRENPIKFKNELSEITSKYRSNIQYFIFKSIILRNLYGVDIMVEATEIAKLRLFLKMVAVVDVDRRADNLGLDPLPDIDFNIRCGNTLVGYANKSQLDRDLDHADDILQELANQEFKQQIEEELRKVASAYKLFVFQQLHQEDDIIAFKKAKHDLRELLLSLNDKLNHRLHSATSHQMDYKEWLRTHQPFNWLAEFYQIIEGNHGFDVIIGNPPYVEISKVTKFYGLRDYKTIPCGNLYACVFERSNQIYNVKESNIGMIVQLPIVCTDRMKEAQSLLTNNLSWICTFDDRPGKLFDDLEHIRATIFITRSKHTKKNYSSCYNRWYSQTRSYLFQNLSIVETYTIPQIDSIPKIGSSISKRILQKLTNDKKLELSLNNIRDNFVYFHNAPQYFTRATDFQPYFWNEKDGEKLSISVKRISCRSTQDSKIICDILNSNLFYLWFIAFSDCRHLNLREIYEFPFSFNNLDSQLKAKLTTLCKSLMNDYIKNKNRKRTLYKTTGQVEYDEYYPKLSKRIIDKIDTILAYHYGFTEEELDFIINYDIKYRMGDELSNERE